MFKLPEGCENIGKSWVLLILLQINNTIAKRKRANNDLQYTTPTNKDRATAEWLVLAKIFVLAER
jgi:DNA-binding HxlR family transcriptional regulator